MTNQPVGSPAWWLARLEAKLTERNKRTKKYRDYYDGKHDLLFATEQFRVSFGSLFSTFADNWCRIVADAPAERLKVVGFRYGDQPEADTPTQRIWQANNLDAASDLGHRGALVSETSSIIVWKSDSDDTPRITVEDPTQVIVENYPGTRTPAAALKIWADDWTGGRRATLFLPDALHRYQSDRGPNGVSIDLPAGVAIPLGGWRPFTADGDDIVANPLAEVPVVPLVNNEDLLGRGESELRQAIPVQDAINKLIADLMVASEYGAMKQRWATGMVIPKNPDTGQPIESFEDVIKKRLWVNPDKDVEFGEFDTTDLSNITGAIDMFVMHLSSQSRTPPHYLNTGSTAGLSGESIKAAETGLVSKTNAKKPGLGDSWERSARIAHRIAGNTTEAAAALEVIWKDSESRTESEHIDAVGKKRQMLGISRRQAWEDAGYTPQQMNRMEIDLADEALVLDAEPEPEPAT